jgi:hypothetical protein
MKWVVSILPSLLRSSFTQDRSRIPLCGIPFRFVLPVTHVGPETGTRVFAAVIVATLPRRIHTADSSGYAASPLK